MLKQHKVFSVVNINMTSSFGSVLKRDITLEKQKLNKRTFFYLYDKFEKYFLPSYINKLDFFKYVDTLDYYEYKKASLNYFVNLFYELVEQYKITENNRIKEQLIFLYDFIPREEYLLHICSKYHYTNIKFTSQMYKKCIDELTEGFNKKIIIYEFSSKKSIENIASKIMIQGYKKDEYEKIRYSYEKSYFIELYLTELNNKSKQKNKKNINIQVVKVRHNNILVR